MNTDSGSNHSPTLSNWEYRVLAVGFTLQCAQQIDKIAREGLTDQATVAALQEPLFVLNPKSYSSVFPKPNLLVPGLTLIESFSRGGSLQRHPDDCPVCYWHAQTGRRRFGESTARKPNPTWH